MLTASVTQTASRVLMEYLKETVSAPLYGYGMSEAF